MGVGEARKKRRHADGKHLSSSLSKKQYTLHEAEVDSSNDNTVTCSRLYAKVPDQPSCRKDASAALGSESSISSFRASAPSSMSVAMTSVDSCGDRAIRERQKLLHEKKGKGSWLINPFKSSTFDTDVEVSEVTSAGSTCSDSVPRGASGFSNVMCRDEVWHRVRDAQKQLSLSYRQTQMHENHWGARYSRRVKAFSDEAGSLCEEPTADMLFEDKRLQYDPCRPDRYLTLGGEREMQCAVFSDASRKFSTLFDVTRAKMPNSNDLGEDSLEIRSADSSRIEVLKEGGIETCDKGHDCVEDSSQTHLSDQGIDDQSRPSYVLSSGRLSLEEEARLGRRAPTIDHAFEQYFSALML